MDRARIIRSISDAPIGKYVFPSKLGFALLQRKDDGLIRINKTGLPSDDLLKESTIKIKFPGIKILVIDLEGVDQYPDQNSSGNVCSIPNRTFLGS